LKSTGNAPALTIGAWDATFGESFRRHTTPAYLMMCGDEGDDDGEMVVVVMMMIYG
jgi:hypothetical protein